MAPEKFKVVIFMSIASTPIETAALKTMLYFDIFDYPLTEEQLYFFFLGQEVTRDELVKACQSPLFTQNVEKQNGFYYLKGKSWLVQHRHELEKRAEELWQMAVGAARRIRHLPLVRGIYISGDLSKGVAGHDSDIDFLIITAANRVWLCKFFLAVFRRIPRFNPHKLLCFNYLISESQLELEEKNIFNAIEIASLAPLYNLTIFNRFLSANRWAAKYFPQYHLAPDPDLCIFHGRSRWQYFLEMPLKNILATWADHALEKLWRLAWRRKYQHEKETQRLLLSGVHRHYSKSHGFPADLHIMQEFQHRLQQWGLT